MITNLNIQSLIYNLINNAFDQRLISEFLLKNDLYSDINYWLIFDYLKMNKPIYTVKSANILIKRLYRNKKLEKILC